MLAFYFNSFSYHREKQSRGPDVFKLAQEASTLQLVGIPKEIEIVGPNGTRHELAQVRVDRDASGEDVYGWVYANRNPCRGVDGKYYHITATIIND